MSVNRQSMWKLGEFSGKCICKRGWSYLCIESSSLLDLGFIEGFTERVDIKACVFVHDFSGLFEHRVVFHTCLGKSRQETQSTFY